MNCTFRSGGRGISSYASKLLRRGTRTCWRYLICIKVHIVLPRSVRTDEARNEDNKPFIKEVPPHPKGAGFYPTDLTKDEFEQFLKSLSPKDKEQAEGYYTVIRRHNKTLSIV